MKRIIGVHFDHKIALAVKKSKLTRVTVTDQKAHHSNTWHHITG